MSEQNIEQRYATMADHEAGETLPYYSDTLHTKRLLYPLEAIVKKRYESTAQAIRKQSNETTLDHEKTTTILRSLNELSRQETGTELSLLAPDWERYQELHLLDEHEDSSGLELFIMPNGYILLVSSEQSTLHDPSNDYNLIKVFKDCGGTVATATDTEIVISAPDDPTLGNGPILARYSIETGGLEGKIHLPVGETGMNNMTVLKNGMIAATFENGQVAIIDLDQPDSPIKKIQQYTDLDTNAINDPIAETAEGLLMVGASNTDLYVFSSDLILLKHYPSGINYSKRVAISPDSYLVTQHPNGFELVDPATGQQEAVYTVPDIRLGIYEACYTKDDKIVVSHPRESAYKTRLEAGRPVHYTEENSYNISVIDRWSGQLVTHFQTDDCASSIWQLPNGDLAVSESDGIIRIFGVKNE